MITTKQITDSVNVQTFTVGALNGVLRAVEAAEDAAEFIRSAIVVVAVALLFACAALLRILAWLVDFTAVVLVGAGKGVVVLAIGAVAVVALTLKATLWAADLYLAAGRKLALA